MKKRTVAGPVRAAVLGLLIVGLAAAASAWAGGRPMLVRAHVSSQEEVLTLVAERFDIVAVGKTGYVDILTTEEGLVRLREEGFRTEIVIEDMSDVQIDPEYHTYAEMLTELQQMEAEHPAIAKLYDIGDAWEKTEGYSDRDIWAMKISDNVAAAEAEPAIMYLGLHHAREPLTLEMCLYLLHYLVDNYGVNPQVTEWIDGTEIWVVPNVNPDGHWVVLEYSLTHPDFEWWRKNTRDTNENNILYEYQWWVAYYHEGVDPNRNYYYKWGYDDIGSSSDIWDQTYRGTGPASEPEVQAIVALLEAENPVSALTYHTHGGWILYPWGYIQQHTPDDAIFEELGDAMAAHNGYTPGVCSMLLYLTNGDYCDHAYGLHGTIAYTIEMADEFIPPGYQIEYHCQLNLPAALELLERLNGPGLYGLVTAGTDNIPLEAEIDFVTAGGDTLWFRMSDGETGLYNKMLEPGVYTVIASAEGYGSEVYTGVVVGSGAPTELDIEFPGTEIVTVELIPDATVVPRGGQLGFTAVVQNQTGVPQAVYGLTEVTLPNGNPYQGNPVFGPVYFTLQPNATVTKWVAHQVPMNAPLGTYDYMAEVGHPPNSVLDTDTFEFEVVNP
jgi:carboxypeptidase T